MKAKLVHSPELYKQTASLLLQYRSLNFFVWFRCNMPPLDDSRFQLRPACVSTATRLLVSHGHALDSRVVSHWSQLPE